MFKKVILPTVCEFVIYLFLDILEIYFFVLEFL